MVCFPPLTVSIIGLLLVVWGVASHRFYTKQMNDHLDRLRLYRRQGATSAALDESTRFGTDPLVHLAAASFLFIEPIGILLILAGIWLSLPL